MIHKILLDDCKEHGPRSMISQAPRSGVKPVARTRGSCLPLLRQTTWQWKEHAVDFLFGIAESKTFSL